jgi:DNA polymerase-3 subunit gamma/tau
MTYQVLARKWRPRNFESLVGQEHVVRALTHALEQKRLHHAYLFTGTRGVGKTTIARILAKALNCDTGITPTPCGKCAACTEIDSGRYVDYIEMDAASYRGVDEMVDLLERAAFAPSSGRYKVYMIDEVHQLSNHAFNAMLKTLEEPPGHVLFILATTDPQKVPVTVLSRCLQFNLKQLPPAQISGQLGRVLSAEGITSEEPGLRLVAQAAHGSMRDALSLLDQAIAYAGGTVSESAVRAMLGSIDEGFLFDILDCVARDDARGALAVADGMESRNLSFDSALQDLAALLHRIALVQIAPQSAGDLASGGDAGRITKLASALGPEDVQLYYQIAIHGRQDLPLAPDEYAGFTMALLRMFAFRPVSDSVTQGAGGGSRDSGAALSGRRTAALAELKGAAIAAPVVAPEAGGSEPRRGSQSFQPAASGISFDGDWPTLARKLPIGGMAKQLAQQSELLEFDGQSITIAIAHSARHLAEKSYQDKLRSSLREHFGSPILLTVDVAAQTAGNTAQDRAVAAINKDEFVSELLQQFDATVVETSINPEQPRSET